MGAPVEEKPKLVEGIIGSFPSISAGIYIIYNI
jgi:hypothetical protein